MPERLTVAEQIVLTTGADYWSTASFPAAGLRSLRLADGPHGLRIQDDENPDHLGLGRSLPATCFPPAVGMIGVNPPGQFLYYPPTGGCYPGSARSR